MTRPSRTMADTRRRRASTGRMMDEIMELARSLPLTRQVLADSLETATPAQMEFMLSWMNEELASRERSKRARLLKQAGLPGVKELDGYDWTPVRFPVDYGREAVYGQINVYGVTTKSERHKRSYWTRTADGNGIGGRKAPVPYGS